jgi:hypothetical protein
MEALVTVVMFFVLKLKKKRVYVGVSGCILISLEKAKRKNNSCQHQFAVLVTRKDARTTKAIFNNNSSHHMKTKGLYHKKTLVSIQTSSL